MLELQYQEARLTDTGVKAPDEAANTDGALTLSGPHFNACLASLHRLEPTPPKSSPRNMNNRETPGFATLRLDRAQRLHDFFTRRY